MSARAYEVAICRSDGCHEVVHNGVREANIPTLAQQSQTSTSTSDGSSSAGPTGAKVDFYQRLDNDDLKAVDWRRKLGCMLAGVTGSKVHSDRQWILKELPDGYTLWEHIRKDPTTGEIGKRQDVYLYGHPHGRRKRFRSPADFFAHLLWLATDVEGRWDNCPCKICYPEGDEPVVRPEARPSTVAATAKAPTVSVSTVSTAAPVPAPASLARPAPVTAPAASPRNSERKYDSLPYFQSRYLYRPGELVWFNKQQGQPGGAWGLAVISMRTLVDQRPRYLIQPLSNPIHHPMPVISEQEDQLRPWLAWSVPPVTHVKITGLTYDQVPWQDVLSGAYGPGDAEVDGSILRAKVIDASYSVFDQVKTPVPAGESHYTGMFLGAEKVWIDEPLRLRDPGSADGDVMVIRKIIVRDASTAEHRTSSQLSFVGDIYSFTEMPNPYRSRAEWPVPDLPARMVADLNFRNEVAAAARKGIFHEWRLREPAARRDLSHIKGRWYETQALLPVLRGQEQFRQDAQSGVTSDGGAWMNGRGDSSGGVGQPSVRMQNRKTTLGAAVPTSFKVSRGLDGKEEDAFPSAADLAGLWRA